MRRGIDEVRRIVRWPKRQAEGKVLILVYHRVTSTQSDPWHLAVTPHHFVEQLTILRRYSNPITLQRLSQVLLLGGNLPDRSVIVTFDDGYADNLHEAKPALECHNIPATVFLTTGYIGSNHEFWWDELERVLLQPGMVPKALRLDINGSMYRWDLGEAAHYDEDDARRYREWRAWEKPPSSRHALYRSLWELLYPLTESERRRVLDKLVGWAGDEPTGRPTHRVLSREEVIALSQGELIELGAHTTTHPALSALPIASQRDEIERSKIQLENILNKEVASFAYPYGKANHYTIETVSVVREVGFLCACSNFAHTVRLSTDPFQLPRVAVPNWAGRKFALWLWRWFRR
jgi:peptidoglycan/xylan/chitin deacetylase (PgdA/CDA1 family)